MKSLRSCYYLLKFTYQDAAENFNKVFADIIITLARFGCSATSTCTSCDGGLNWEINSTKCVCKQGYIADGGSCVLCGVKIPGCTDCQNGSCSMCDEGNNWELSAGTCVCKQEYQK